MSKSPGTVVECIVAELDRAQTELERLPANKCSQRARDRIERAGHLCELVWGSRVSWRNRTRRSQWLEEFRAEIRNALPGGAPCVDSAAQLAGMSPRTLQRRLAEEGLTYRQLLDQVRFLLALTMAEGSDASIGEIARLLGYSATPHFSRAFRRWTGTTFRALRHRLVSDQA